MLEIEGPQKSGAYDQASLSFINQVEVNYSHKEAGKERRTFSGSPLLGWGRGLPGRRDKLH